MRIGLLVNPVAGMGGAVGLKGTDGKVAEAVALGAKPRAHPRAVAFLRALPGEPTIVTAGGAMGEDACAEADVSALVVYAPAEQTSAQDTVEAARAIAAAGVDVILFVGGDGTAADVSRGLADAPAQPPALGVPAGVKMYSAVFADTPEAAAVAVTSFDETVQHEVLDIDEDAFRRGELRVALKGMLRVPAHARVQAGKVADDDEVEAESLAEAVVDALPRDATVVLGAGGTMMLVKQRLGLDGTLLGLDVARISADGGATLVAKDVRERDLLAMPPPDRIVLSPIGAQGFFLGRGNLPLTPAVLSRVKIPDAILVVATPWKLLGTRALKVDSGDPSLDARFPRFVPVLTGHGQTKLMRLLA